MMDEDQQDRKDEPIQGMHRRTFLTSLTAAGALAAFVPRSVQAASTKISASSSATGPASFIILGDFGSGNNLSSSEISPNPNPNEQAVADGIQQVLPPTSGGYIFSVGDQVYIPDPNGDEQTQATNVSFYDAAVGQFYAAYILFPAGSVSAYAGSGAAQMNFYAMLGDHDWWHQPRVTTTAVHYPADEAAYPLNPSNNQTVYLIGDIAGTDANFSGYLQYFANQGAGSSSGNNRYFDFVRGSIHWIVLSSDPNETALSTDGSLGTSAPFSLSNAYWQQPGQLMNNGLTFGQDNLVNSAQGQWFQQVAAASASPWKFVGTHYPPYSSSQSTYLDTQYDGHPSTTYMQWGYEAFGVDLVVSGHVHGYERLYANGVTYLVVGAGGTFEPLAHYPTIVPQSLKIIAFQYGFLSAVEGAGVILFSYHVVESADTPATEAGVQDRFALLKGGTLAAANIAAQNMIHVTSGGGTLELTSTTAIGSVLVGTGDLTVRGKGTLHIAGVNRNFTGALFVSHSTLKLAASSALDSTVTLSLAGATLDVRNHAQIFATPLALSGHSTIKVDRKSRLHFAASRRGPWSSKAVLVIEGKPGPRSLRFGTGPGGLSKRQLKQIRFRSQPGARAALDEAGYLVAR